MSAVQYPFIDIAAHPRVRDHFAAGKAVVLFTRDMKDVLWANGRGAQLFGKDVIYDLIDQGPPRLDLTLRQAQATARQLQATGDQRSFMMRMTAGFERLAVQALCELIALADGETAVLLAVPAAAEAPQPAECARQMLEGFDEPNTHVAVLDGDGHVISSSPDFGTVNLTPHTARMLVTLAAHDRDRLVKRPVPTGAGYLPAAIARLSDDPVLNLLLIVEADAPEPAIAFEERPAAPLPEERVIDPLASGEPADLPLPDETAGTVVADPVEDSEDAVPAQEEEALAEAPATSTVAIEIPALETSTPETSALVKPPEDAAPAQAAVEPEDEQPVAATAAEPPVSGFRFPHEARATRFVWKIDAQGIFCEISPELAATVGPHAAEVVGLAFTDVAALFNLDPEGKIGELLQRRDTWSGKTIFWPVEGTSLCVPIDLAALPTYTRTREFDGFRGFGIVRISDVEEDPLALGLTLAPDDTDLTDVVEDDADIAEGSETEAYAADDAGIADAEDTAAETGMADALTVAAPAETDAEPAEGIDDTAGAETAEPNAPDADTPDQPLAPETLKDAGDTASADEPTSMPLLWPTHEKPALRLVETTPRYSEKVIRLEERRPGAREGLTPVEQAAFREIARRLEVFRQNEEPAGEPQRAAATATEDDAAPFGEPDDHGTNAAEDATPAQSAADPSTEADSATDLSADDDTAEPVLSEPADETEGLFDDALSAELASEPVAEDADPVETQQEATLPDAPQDDQDAFAQTPDDAVSQDVLPEESDAEDHEAPPVAADVDDAAPETHDAENARDVEGEERISLAEAYAQAMPLRQRPELSPDVVDQMPVALLVHSGERLIHANPEFLRLTGYETLDALAEVGGLDALLQTQELEDKTSDAGGMVVVRADDSIVPVTARLQSVRWDGATALILALMPVNDPAAAPDTAEADEVAPAEPDEHARQAEKLSRMAVEVDELRAILDTATDGVVLLGSEGDIRSMNRAASALFNYDNEETAGKPFVMLFAHESQKSVLDYLAGLAGHGVASLLNDGREVIGREASGGFLPLFMTIGHLTSSNGYCAVIRDITQWKRTEEELRNAKRAAETANAHKSDFLAHVSHEIRTPLNAIIGFADMMATERLGPIGHQRYVEYANDIGRSGRHVLDIVNDLLDISKIEAGEMELDFAAVGLNETVAEAVSLVQPQANGQRVIIRTALSHAVPPVVADLRSIKQIVLNILANAIRFTPSGGQIVVSTAYEANGNVVLRIRDTGIGMTRAELELAMKPFRQVAGAARKRGDGTGLGLPLTKAMVDANRAAFAIHSAPNEGTLVEVTFPSPRVLAN
ncbi:ATP-binding protein [Rhizobium sp. SGZ-381]|uniref:ATP-binding protein n=1 Tax=Rhizobium sp. SGZ-381 TaxID=3342800 RepID=UPI0036717872